MVKIEVENFINQFWKYYVNLENDFLSLERYVTFESDNLSTYSLEYNRLYQAIGSEVDVVAKELCRLLGNNGSKNITGYCKTINDKCTKFKDEEIEVKIFKTKIYPWKDCDKKAAKKELNNPIWWELYNKVKHFRLAICDYENCDLLNKPFYKAANLKNVLDALAGLFQLEFYCLLKICDTEHDWDYFSLLNCFDSKLFIPYNWSNFKYSFMGNDFIDEDKLREKLKKENIFNI